MQNSNTDIECKHNPNNNPDTISIPEYLIELSRREGHDCVVRMWPGAEVGKDWCITQNPCDFCCKTPFLSLPSHLMGSTTSGMGTVGLNVVSRFGAERANVSPFNVAPWAVWRSLIPSFWNLVLNRALMAIISMLPSLWALSSTWKREWDPRGNGRMTHQSRPRWLKVA